MKTTSLPAWPGRGDRITDREQRKEKGEYKLSQGHIPLHRRNKCAIILCVCHQSQLKICCPVEWSFHVGRRSPCGATVPRPSPTMRPMMPLLPLLHHYCTTCAATVALLRCRRYRQYRWTRIHPSLMLAFAGGSTRLESQETILSSLQCKGLFVT